MFPVSTPLSSVSFIKLNRSGLALRGQLAMMIAMPSKTPKAVLTGSRKITAMEQWDQDYVDLVVPGFIRFDGESGELDSLWVHVLAGACACRGEGRQALPLRVR